MLIIYKNPAEKEENNSHQAAKSKETFSQLTNQALNHESSIFKALRFYLLKGAFV